MCFCLRSHQATLACSESAMISLFPNLFITLVPLFRMFQTPALLQTGLHYSKLVSITPSRSPLPNNDSILVMDLQLTFPFKSSYPQTSRPILWDLSCCFRIPCFLISLPNSLSSSFAKMVSFFIFISPKQHSTTPWHRASTKLMFVSLMFIKQNYS